MQMLLEQPALIGAMAIAAAATVTDLRSRTVPNRLTAAGAALGLCLNFWTAGTAGLGRSIAGAAAGFCLFLPFFLLGGMGGGDVKLMGALGACAGALLIVQTALAASIAGALLALAVAAKSGLMRRTLANTGRLLARWARRGPRPDPELNLDAPGVLSIPYAVPIAAGLFFVVARQS